MKIINGANGISHKNSFIIEKLSSHLNQNVKIMFNNKVRKGDPTHYHADITETLKLDWSPVIKIEDGISNYVNNFLKNYD